MRASRWRFYICLEKFPLVLADAIEIGIVKHLHLNSVIKLPSEEDCCVSNDQYVVICTLITLAIM